MAADTYLALAIMAIAAHLLFNIWVVCRAGTQPNHVDDCLSRADDYETSLIAEFEKLLPEKPPRK